MFLSRFCFLSQDGVFEYDVSYPKVSILNPYRHDNWRSLVQSYAPQNFLLYFDAQWPSVYKNESKVINSQLFCKTHSLKLIMSVNDADVFRQTLGVGQPEQSDHQSDPIWQTIQGNSRLRMQGVPRRVRQLQCMAQMHPLQKVSLLARALVVHCDRQLRVFKGIHHRNGVYYALGLLIAVALCFCVRVWECATRLQWPTTSTIHCLCTSRPTNSVSLSDRC